MYIVKRGTYTYTRRIETYTSADTQRCFEQATASSLPYVNENHCFGCFMCAIWRPPVYIRKWYAGKPAGLCVLCKCTHVERKGAQGCVVVQPYTSRVNVRIHCDVYSYSHSHTGKGICTGFCTAAVQQLRFGLRWTGKPRGVR